jgi:hypothetical protein
LYLDEVKPRLRQDLSCAIALGAAAAANSNPKTTVKITLFCIILAIFVLPSISFVSSNKPPFKISSLNLQNFDQDAVA